MDIVDFAWQVIAMDREIRDLRAENARLMKSKADYDELLNSSLRHGQAMMGNTLKLLLTPGVTDALIQNHTPHEVANEQ